MQYKIGVISISCWGAYATHSIEFQFSMAFGYGTSNDIDTKWRCQMPSENEKLYPLEITFISFDPKWLRLSEHKLVHAVACVHHSIALSTPLHMHSTLHKRHVNNNNGQCANANWCKFWLFDRIPIHWLSLHYLSIGHTEIERERDTKIA